MRRACVDIGSNTTRLLVADAAAASGGLTVIDEQRRFTRIGAALGADRAIPAAKRAEVVTVVAEYVAHARALGVAEVHGVATAAIRDAANRDVLLSELRDGAGLDVAVVTAAAEARLAFRGVIGMHRALSGAAGLTGAAGRSTVGVLDVGGGSSEVVVGDPGGEIEWWMSLPLGSSSLASSHLHHDPPTAAELATVRAEVSATAAAIGYRGPVPNRTFAVGGSATSLGRLTGPVLDSGALHRALTLLTASPAAEVALRHAIDPERVRLLPAGLIVLQVLGERLGARVEVGRGGIREGVLLEAFSR